MFSSLVYFSEKEFGKYEQYIVNTTIVDYSNNTWTFIGNGTTLCIKNIFFI